jgi:hypothetical protein
MHIFPENCKAHAMQIRHTSGPEIFRYAYITVQHSGISPASVDDVTRNPARTACGALPIQAPARRSNPARQPISIFGIGATVRDLLKIVPLAYSETRANPEFPGEETI